MNACTTAPVYFQGQQLPNLRPGKVWGMELYPGGRKCLRQFSPELLQLPDDAALRLAEGRMARVWLDDAEITVILWNQQKRRQATVAYER